MRHVAAATALNRFSQMWREMSIMDDRERQRETDRQRRIDSHTETERQTERDREREGERKIEGPE